MGVGTSFGRAVSSSLFYSLAYGFTAQRALSMTLHSNETLLSDRAFCELYPLAQFQPIAEQFGWPQSCRQPYRYTIVLVEEAGALRSGATPAAGLAMMSIYFIGPGQLTGAHTSDRPGTVLQFTDDFFFQEADIRDISLANNLFYGAGEVCPLWISSADASSFAFLVNGLKQELKSPGLRNEALARTYLKAFLILCLRLRQEQGPAWHSSVASTLFLRFRSILEEHYRVLKTVAQYADLLHITANHLSETIKKETGRTAGGHIRHRIMAEAQRLTESSSLSLKEIAHQLGYDDVAHFSRLFKRCVGLNFSQYKGQLMA